ncbi:MAG: SH3 domain-containing protein [Clostridia bacterium]|nr:SH3 domain-containing protein [Clostridia bacterium]
MKVVKRVFFIALMIFVLCQVNSYAATGTVKSEGARMRAEANTSSDVVTLIEQGETVEIVEKNDDWYKVKYENSTGYIRGDLLEIMGEVEEVQPKEEPATIEETEKTEENKTEPETETKTEPENKEEKVNTTGEKNIKTNTAIRITPCLFSSVLGEAVAGNRITVEKVLNNWGKVKLDNGITGWVMLSMLEEVKEAEVYEEQPSTKIGYINVSAAIIRSKPIQSEDTIVAEISRNKSVEIMGEENDWYKILYEGKEAYIAKRLVSDNKVEEASRSGQQERVEIETPVESVTENKVEESKKIEEKKEETKVEAVPPTETKQEESAPAVATSKGEEVVALAKKYLGYSYVYGGSGPNSFDCSGFTQYIYKQFGISLAHSAVTQANNGTYVSKDNLMPGDLVIFRDWDNVSIGHCGIYIGGGQFIHAANSKRGVVTDTLNSGYYYERYVTGRRLL